MNTDYLNFLEQKKVRIEESGFHVDESDLNPHLFDFQRFFVKKALKAGKYAVFADCGLGKTLIQMEWARHVVKHTDKPVLILCPLAVSGQTIQEGEKFGIAIDRLKSDVFDSGIFITNYDQLENVNPSIFSGVVLDECFAPDTKIKVLSDGILHDKYIKDCSIGEIVLNCTGFDTITNVKRKKVDYAIKIGFNGKGIVCSPRHPFFTQRGWVAAKEIRRGDAIVSTDKAMRILRREFSYIPQTGVKEKVLRDVMLSEMENETAGIFSKSAYTGSSGKTGKEKEGMVQNGSGKERDRANQEIKPYGESRIETQMFGDIEGDGTQTFSAWGQWSWDDIASAINEGCIVRRMESGICYINGKASTGLSDQLQSRFSQLREKNSDRSGWELSLQQKRIGQEEGRKTGYFGVESFEVLEQTDTRLDKYRDADGSLYFIDLSIERHPSFTINECLVHNSSLLKNHEGATKNAIIEAFMHTPFKLACTATPSPNDFMELGNHSEFLNVMPRNEMLAMYFVHDGGETAKWRLKGHSEEIFWQWVAGWSVMLTKPSDIGFSAIGYELPPLNFIEKQIVTPKRDNSTFFNDVAVSATDFNGELRLTKVERMSEVIDIVNNSYESFIVWVKQNEEADYLMSRIPDAVEVRGSDSVERKENVLLGFAKGQHRVLVTKAKIAQYGLNFQNCRNQVFASLDFSFESLYQAIRRSYRFGQQREVNIYIVTTDTMQNVIHAIETKQRQFEKMQAKMAEYSNKNIQTGNLLKMEREYEVKKGDMWEARLGDCVQLIQDVPTESLDFSVFSPPFADLYTYSDELEDMGNSRDYNEFLTAFNYLTKELYRTIRIGRNVAIHCMDLPIQKGKHGFIGLRDFSGLILKSMEDAGFIYHSRVTIWKNPVTEMQRTKALGLLHKQLKKDATMSRVGIPDYVLIFRKDGDRDNPVSVDIPVDIWQKWASPVWMDIDYGDTLNRNEAREEKDEKHICPLQLPTIERLIGLYTNPGDLVFTPFGGIFSEIYQAVKMGRRGLAFELKKQYFDVGTKNMVGLEMSKQQLDIFSMATI